jgi:hypothetical protein
VISARFNSTTNLLHKPAPNEAARNRYNATMRFRKARIAWSVAWGFVAVLVCVLWVRSYRWDDDLFIKWSGQRYLVIHSMCGSTSWYVNSYARTSRIQIESESVAALTEGIAPAGGELLDFEFTKNHTQILPHWIFALGFALLAAIPWLRLRFSIRTLLIATTRVAPL